MKEIWKDIVGYEGLYQVSNTGRVKSIKGGRWNTGKEKILKAQKDKGGYLRLDLSKDGINRRYYIHRLVSIAFIENPNNLPEINHKDECKENNCVENLEWCTSKYNCNYGTHNEKMAASLSKKVLCVDTGKTYKSLRELCRENGYSSGFMSDCLNGKYETAYGYKWKYAI